MRVSTTRKTLSIGVLVFCGAALPCRAADRILRTELTLDAPVSRVWQAWTTEEGVKTFFAPGAHVETRVDGAFEIFFDPTAAPGRRGAEGQRILALEPERRFAFTWDAPPDQPEIRRQHTMVVLEFEALDAKHTRLRFTHLGWGEGADWDKAYAYFDHAWNAVVLPRFVRSLHAGPIAWGARNALAPIASTLQVRLAPQP